MKKFVLILLPIALVFFAIGVGWGVSLHRNQSQALAQGTPIRVLCAENWLSTQALEKFSREHNVRIQEWTYSTPSEFLRQMANSDGKVDVVCVSSLLVKSLVRSHWIKKMDFSKLPNSKLIAVDFTRLPYDPDSEYSVPLFWNLYGLFGKDQSLKDMTWKQAWHSKRISLWGEELNVLQIMNHLGLNIEQRLQEEDSSKIGKGLDEEIHRFAKSAVNILKPSLTPLSAEASMLKTDWIQIPLARVARLLGENSPYHFILPEDGATLELGVLAVGEKSQQPELAMALINELISTESALETHNRLDSGVVHSTLSGLASIVPLEQPQALRQFPLTRLQFPDLNIEALPRFQKIFDESITARY